MRTILIALAGTLLCVSLIGCGGTSNNNSNSVADKVCDPISDTPTEAYKRIFAAVKEKNSDKIKAEMSQESQAFAESLAARQKNPIAKVYENAFTGTTFSSTLPEIRDERLSSCYGAIEVRNNKEQRWEDLPFVNEGGTWKFAIGELFSGAYKSPGKGMDEIEHEAANVARGSSAPPPANMMANTNSHSNTNANANVPKYDGPQVEPLPKKK